MANTKITTNVIADDAITLDKMAGLARGKIIYGDSSGNPAALAVGSNGQVLKSDGTDISWGTDSSNDRDGAAVFNESGAAVDFRIEGDTVENLFFVDGSADKIGIGTNSPDRLLTLQGDNSYMWIKDAGGGNVGFIGGSGENDGLMRLYKGDHNAKVEIHSDAASYFNGGDVGIGTSSPSSKLTVTEAGDGNTPTMHIIDSADSEVAWFEGHRAADTGAFISVYHNPSTIAESNRSGIRFQGGNDAGQKVNYGVILQRHTDYTDGTEDGELQIHQMVNGTLEEKVAITPDQLRLKGDAGSSFIRVDNRADGHDTGFEIYQNASRKWELYNDDSNTDAFEIRPNGASGKFTFTQDGELGIGYANPGAFHANYRNLVVGSGSGDEGMIIYSGAGSAGAIAFARDAAGNTDSYDGYIEYNQSDRSMRFGTNAANERMRITGTGTFSVGTTSTDNTPDSSGNGFIYSGSAGWCAIATSQAAGLYINRTDDSGGDLVSFRSSGSEKGTISISGSTVSYNAFMGSHYTETTGDDPLLGTVMEFTGELVENRYASQKRLSKAKVSDTAESTKVYGVYLSDSSEDTGELIASLGASWCRIHKDETIAIGDLLVSKGDGTAKVQSDDIIRSKTIGKVTSTTKKETYEDDSYIVPVVLYCG